MGNRAKSSGSPKQTWNNLYRDNDMWASPIYTEAALQVVYTLWKMKNPPKEWIRPESDLEHTKMLPGEVSQIYCKLALQGVYFNVEETV